jgi:diguanylate cyclase (GGDEF)-like protein
MSPAPTSSDRLIPPNGSKFADAVTADSLALLFTHSFHAVFFSLGVAGLLCWSLWDAMPHAALTSWLWALGISSIIRLAMFSLYFRRRPQGRQLLAWRWPYLATLSLSAGIWGFGALWLMTLGDEYSRLVILFYVAGMTGGSVMSYSAHRGGTMIATLLVIGPTTIWLYTLPSPTMRAMALAATAFMAISVQNIKARSQAMRKQLEIGYELNEAHGIAQKLAHEDELTGLNNRRAFMNLSKSMVHLCRRKRSPVSCLVIDVDHFKQVNDRHGHGAGDSVLMHMGTLLAREFRSSDVCGRLGGEEFCVVLPETDLQGAAAAAEQFRRAVDSQPVMWLGQPIPVSVSIGISSGDDDLTELLHRADVAMYEAKTSGRNRVVCQSRLDR